MLFFKCFWTIFSLGTPVLLKLFDIRFSYKHCNFSRVCLFASSETKGQSVGLGEKAGRKFSSTGKRATGNRLGTKIQKFKWMPPPDWAQKMLCIIVPNRRTASPQFFFVSSYTTAIVSPNLPGSFTTFVRARKTFIFNFPNQKRRNVWDAISRSNSICTENILFLTDHNVS